MKTLQERIDELTQSKKELQIDYDALDAQDSMTDDEAEFFAELDDQLEELGEQIEELQNQLDNEDQVPSDNHSDPSDATRAVSLWLQNDEGLYNETLGQPANWIKTFCYDLWPDGFCDGEPLALVDWDEIEEDCANPDDTEDEECEEHEKTDECYACPTCLCIVYPD